MEERHVVSVVITSMPMRNSALRQRDHSDASEQTYQNDLFALCGDLIDEYQSQSPFDISSATSAAISTPPATEAAGSSCTQNCPRRLACTSADLAYAVGIACQPDFKVGFFGRGKKTLAELERRRKAFFEDAAEKARTQLEWHIKTYFTDFARQQHGRPQCA